MNNNTRPSVVDRLLEAHPEPVPDIECVACYAARNPAPEHTLKVSCLIGVATGVRFGKQVPLCEECLETFKTLRNGLSEGLGES